MAVLRLLLCLSFVSLVLGKGSEAQIECTPEVMKVSIPMDGDRQISYLDQLKYYKPCKPALENNMATFILDLQDPHKCGVTRVTNSITGKRTFYHKIVIEDAAGGRETVTVRCVVTGKLRALARRAVDPFPPDLIEPEVNITLNKEGRAPEPILGAVVKQDGKQVSGEISVSPGTPLSMEIFLDNESAPVYGLLVNYMQVTDTGKQHETIILNGCSVDTYLFDNFITDSGDVLMAKFRAFKFPDTTYVQFKGTVTVCLDKCQGVQCTNGALGYGRRRRAIETSPASNKVYEVSLTTFIKVENKDGDTEDEDMFALLKNLKVANQMLGDMDGTPATVAERTPDNKLVLHKAVQCTNGALGYGRRRRAIETSPASNKVYEVSLTTFIKVENKDGDTEDEDMFALLKNLKVANQMLGDMDGTPATVAERTPDNKLVLHKAVSHAVSLAYSSMMIVVCLWLALFK